MNGPSLTLELFAMHRPYLGASMRFKLLANLPHVGKGGKPMHLSIVTSVHLVRAKASLSLHVLRGLGFLEINENGELNTREEIPIDERIISPLVIRAKHIIRVLLGL
mmetsp:Transcript_12236/g.22020  ORF Transcript_12236/g.22020 Transcript_12236/m.22020 type:complete len:107 (-) Transcript_12236:717-1037(-)